MCLRWLSGPERIEKLYECDRRQRNDYVSFPHLLQLTLS